MKDTLKVKDLIAILKSVNPEMNIILQKDPEGNEYAPVSFFDTGKCKFIKSTFREACRVGPGVLTPDFKKYGLTEKDVVLDGEDAFIFIPNY